jgi:hypothetical protein
MAWKSYILKMITITHTHTKKKFLQEAFVIANLQVNYLIVWPLAVFHAWMNTDLQS